MSSRVIRITMFKIPSQESQTKLAALYSTLSATATRNGSPYILSLAAGPAKPDERSQGFTFVAKSEFKNMDDWKYYDVECEAHKTLKKGAATLGVEGILTVYYEPGVLAGQGI